MSDLLRDIQAFLAARGNEGDEVAGEMAEGLAEKIIKEEVDLPPGINVVADPDGKRITISYGHTISLGNFQYVKPHFSISRNLREGESAGDVEVLKRLYREGLQAYTWLVGIEMRHAEVLSEKGPWEFVKALLDYAQLPETTETGLVKAGD